MTTAEPFPVGEYIQDAMDAAGLTVEEVAALMDGDYDVNYLALQLVLHVRDDPRMTLGDDMAAGLALAFGTSKEVWINLDNTWRETMLRRN